MQQYEEPGSWVSPWAHPYVYADETAREYASDGTFQKTVFANRKRPSGLKAYIVAYILLGTAAVLSPWFWLALFCLWVFIEGLKLL